MDTVQMLGSAMGLGLLAGIRLYATAFALGLAVRFGWFDLNPSVEHLRVLAEWPVLSVSGTAMVAEFLADKIPWFDSLWDSVHTVIRPVGAAALGVTALGNFDPVTQTMIGLLAGGVAFTGHTSKAATRLAVNHSPEPFSNWALSFAEDLFVPAGLWLFMEYPEVAVAAVSIFLVIFAWLSPKVFRLLKLSWTAIAALFGRWFATASTLAAPPLSRALSPLADLPFRALPQPYMAKVPQARVGIPCAATRSIKGLKNSTGYLAVSDDELAFVTRRMFRMRTHSVPFASITEVFVDRGIFMDRLVLRTRDRDYAFDVFKGPRARRASRQASLPA